MVIRPLTRRHFRVFAVSSCCVFLIWVYLRLDSIPALRNAWAGEIVDFGSWNNETGFPYAIVPNVVHLVHFKQPQLRFVEMVSILAAHRNQKPDKIVVHCDCTELTGKYWDAVVRRVPELEIQYEEMPRFVFGKRLSSVFHASDVARLRLMMRHGGIYIDGDVYIVSSLDAFRKFEFALGWPPSQYLGTQVLVAHKNARFLKLWYESYRYYRPTMWYYNAGELPTQSILQVHPHLVHRVPTDFGVNDLSHMLYGLRSDQWQDYRAIHLLFNHRSYLVPSDTTEVLNEKTICNYGRTFGDMARLVLFGSEQFCPNSTRL